MERSFLDIRPKKYFSADEVLLWKFKVLISYNIMDDKCSFIDWMPNCSIMQDKLLKELIFFITK